MNKQKIKLFIYTCKQGSTKQKHSSFNYQHAGDESWLHANGYFVSGKQYVCYATDSASTIRVCGFFKMRFMHQRLQGKKLIDWYSWSKKPGFYSLLFEARTCKELLVFKETFTKTQRVDNGTQLQAAKRY